MAAPTGFGGRDFPDFGVSDTYHRTAQVNDMSELAVRLGSSVWFDRVGTVLFIDNFQYGIGNWHTSAFPTAATPVISAKYHDVLPYSCKLSTTVVAGSASTIYRAFPFTYISQMGIEFHFKATSGFNRLTFASDIYTGTIRYGFAIRFEYANNAIYVMGPGEVYTQIADLNVYMGAATPFHAVKFVVDVASGEYVKMFFNERTISLGGNEFYQVASGESARLYAACGLTGKTGQADTVWIDNVIITINEPKV